MRWHGHDARPAVKDVANIPFNFTSKVGLELRIFKSIWFPRSSNHNTLNNRKIRQIWTCSIALSGFMFASRAKEHVQSI